MLKEKSECVKVVVRCRPLSEGEVKDGNKCVITVESKTAQIFVANPVNVKEQKTFSFDYTYDWKSTQETIFTQTAQPIIESVMEGYNGTIFAYGQTGTGKTFTMEGCDTDDLRGILPRTINWIFKNIRNYSDKQFLVRVSFVEIYNEEVRDLLNKNLKHKLNVREKEGVFYVEDCKILKVESAQQMIAIMHAGVQNRATGATKMNSGSSRSHSIFSIIVESSEVDSSGETHYKMGKLNLVDLAGSERQSKTEATGDRFKEATKINLSLSILGNVISKLVSNKNHFVPYRESKLTMLLQDSLGGNTKTVMIANVGPADYNYDETLNTLWYADNAKKIKNKPKINEDPKDAQLRQFQEEIELLKKQLSSLGKGGAINVDPKTGESVVYVEDEKAMKTAVENLEKEKEDFKRQHEEEIQKIKELKNMAEGEKKKLIEKIKQEIAEQKKAKDEVKDLLLKYRQRKKLVLKGDDTEKKVKLQQDEINRHKEELEAKKREEKLLQKELEMRKEKNTELKFKYESAQANIDDLNEKVNILRQKMDEAKVDNKMLQDRLSNEYLNVQEDIKNIQIENMMKEFIINTFISQEEKEKLAKCIEFNEKEGVHVINRMKAIKDTYVSNRDMLKSMRKNKIQVDSPSILKAGGLGEEEKMIKLKLEQPESFVVKFKGEQNEQVITEIEHILRDDDSDLLYYDKELNILDNNLTPSILKLNNSVSLNKSVASDSTKSSTSSLSEMSKELNQEKKIRMRLPSAKKN